MNEVTFSTDSAVSTQDLAARVGAALRGGEVIELISDVGGGKTEFVRGLARGMGSQDAVMSPTFTISRIYRGEGLSLHHFDFYRLNEPGVMLEELSECIDDNEAAVAVEWSDVVSGVLPQDRLQVRIKPTGENDRDINIIAKGPEHIKLIESLV